MEGCAEEYEILTLAFRNARINDVSATPLRADGRLMSSPISDSCAVRKAFSDGYVRDLKALVLKAATVCYARRESGREVEVDLDVV